MKRFSILITCVFLCFGYSAASAWAIWEGNAGIAAASEFPGKGMYAKSDMFPKNTVVLIENLETGIKVRAIVTGSSGISGLVAVLSPDTAAALNIRSGSVSRVRISIPSVVSEKSATGVAGTEAAPVSADPDVNPAAAAAGAAPIPLASIADAQDNPLVPLDKPENAAAPTTAPVDTAATTADTTADTTEATTAESPAATEVVAAAGVAPVPEATPAADESAAVAEPDALATDTESKASPSPAFYDEPELAATEAPVTEPPVNGEEALPEETDSVALVPTDLNPPARSDALDAAAVTAAATPAAAPGVAPAAVAIAPVAAATAPAPAAAAIAPVAAVAAPAPSAAAVSDALAALPCVSSLAKGSYYVQIASYSDPVHAKKIVDSYAIKYPIVVEQGLASRGSVLKVCVGPVKKDEYGAILERFKSLGFKDAFVRKGE